MAWIKGETSPKNSAFLRKAFSQGFTLTELLIIVAILGLFSLVLFSGVTRHLSKSRDAQRKDDLDGLRIALEDYYNDNQCYPDLALLDQCGGTGLSPYLKEIPCDPKDRQPYVTFSLGGNWCAGYRVLVRLENTQDPNIESMGCDSLNGCYYPDKSYNFGIAMGAPLVSNEWLQESGPTPAPTATPAPTSTPAPTNTPAPPTPTPTLAPGAWVIAPDGACAHYTDDYLPTAGCPATYPSYAACFAVSGCSQSCTEDDVPLVLRCER